MSWQAQTAKAKFSELLRAAREKGPQTITVRGREEFVLATKAAFEDNSRRPSTWEELFAPVQGLGDELELPPREPEATRELNLEDR